MKKIITYSLSLFLILVLAYGCTSNSSSSSEPETGAPVIASITSDKAQIQKSGADHAVLTCNATGGNLKFVWEVDTGDLIPMNSSRSQMQFTAAACCVGEKTIKCTVSNSLGSVSKTITITVLDGIAVPQIINIVSDSTNLHLSAGGSSNIVCYASGGNLKYAWSSAQGLIAFPSSDSSKVKFTPNVVGLSWIRCKVSNELGSVLDSASITVAN